MNQKPKAQLPLVVKIAVVITFFNSWVLFEETVIDRFGLWQYLPLYKLGLFCTWDIMALLIIISAVWYAFSRWWRQQQHSASETEKIHCFLKLKRCIFCR